MFFLLSSVDNYVILFLKGGDNMQNEEVFEGVLDEYRKDNRVNQLLVSQLIDKNIISRSQLGILMSYNTKAKDVNPAMLCAVYDVILKAHPEAYLFAKDYFFTREEQTQAQLLHIEDSIEKFPITFKDVTKLDIKEEFALVLSYRQIVDMFNNRIFQIRADVQRESDVYEYNGERIPCVHYDAQKVQEITESILHHQQHPNLIRLHLIKARDEEHGLNFEYDSFRKELTIFSGVLLNIDGNHRVNAIANAVNSAPQIADNKYMIVALTIGTAAMAREIIVQEEKRTPIVFEHVKSLSQSESCRTIVNNLKTDEQLEECYQFCTTTEQSHSGGGLLVEHLFADAVEKAFSLKAKERRSVLDGLSSYISEFLQEFYYLVEDFNDSYYSQYYLHDDLIMANPYVVYGLLKTAAILKDDDNWREKLESIVSRLDFDKEVNLQSGRLKQLSEKCFDTAVQQEVGA